MNYRTQNKGSHHEVWLRPKTCVLDGHNPPQGCYGRWLPCLSPRGSPDTHKQRPTHTHPSPRDLRVDEQYGWQNTWPQNSNCATDHGTQNTCRKSWPPQNKCHKVWKICSTNVKQIDTNTHTVIPGALSIWCPSVPVCMSFKRLQEVIAMSTDRSEWQTLFLLSCSFMPVFPFLSFLKNS